MKSEITIKIFRQEPYAEITGIDDINQKDIEMIQKVIDIVGKWIEDDE